MANKPISAPRIAAAYIRVSTEEQADQSPESQLIEIRKYADRNGYIIPDEFIFMDEGISGKRSENRPQFQKMIGTAKEKPAPFDTILLWKFSRFARNQEESIVYKALLRKQCGVNVTSVSEPLPGGPFASLIERIIEWFDEFYSIRLSQEVKRTMTVKAGRGEFQCSPSFGYRAKIEAGQKTTLEIVQEEASLVREIYSRFLAGEGFFGIAKWLNAQGVTTHRGNAFENRSVEYIICNPVYIGKLRWTPTGRCHRDFENPDTIVAEANHDPIIDIDTWNAAQDRVAHIKAAWGYKSRPTYELKDWLSGVIRCSECGSTLIFQKPHFFKCNNYMRGRCSSSQNVRVDLLHEAVLDRLEQDRTSTLPLSYTVTRTDSSGGGDLARLETSLSDLERRQARLLDAYLGGVMELGAYGEMKNNLEAGITDTRCRIEELKAQLSDNTAGEALRESISKALETLRSADSSLEEKNNAIRGIADRMTFNKAQATLDITYRVIF